MKKDRMKNKEVVRMPPGRWTPGGGVMAEIYHFDEEGNPAPKALATRVIIRELDENGNLVQEVFGSKSNEVPSTVLEVRVRGSTVPWVTIDGSIASYYRPGDIVTDYEPAEVALPPEVQEMKAAVRPADGSTAFWNGKCYCLRAYHLLRNVDDERPGLHLVLGPTDYFAYCATCLSLDKAIPGRGSTLRQLFLSDRSPLAEPIPFLANGFGINLLPITKDNYGVIAQRSPATAVYPGHYSVGVNEGLSRPIDGHGTSEDAPDVHRAAARGILEELGITLGKESVGEEVRFVSFGLDLSTYQYGLQGYAILNASKSEVEEYYTAARDKFEHTRLYFVPLTAQKVATFVANHQPWAPAGITCFLVSVQAAYRNQGFGLDPCNLLKHLRNADIDLAFAEEPRSVRLWDRESKTIVGLTARCCTT